MKNKDINLKPCPFCGNSDLELQTGTKDREGTPTSVLCATCGAVGPWCYVPESDLTEVNNLWNRRIPIRNP